MPDTTPLLLQIQKLERELAQLWSHRKPDFKLQAKIRAKSDERLALKKQLNEMFGSMLHNREVEGTIASPQPTKEES